MTEPVRNMAAVLTAPGRGAVATVAYRGDLARLDAAALFSAANRQRLTEQQLNRIAFGLWGHDPGEEVVVCRVAEQQCEVHCHGGDAAVARVLSQLRDAGAVIVDWRTFLEETEGSFAADAAEALAEAATERTAAFIVRQIEGPLRDCLKSLAALDPVARRDEALEVLDRILAWSEFGRHLTQSWRVVLYGAPNVGKSSLINALVGFERAIVFDQPGTTRDVVTAETALDGWPIRFSDTAGLRSTVDEIESAGIERAKAELASADLCLRVTDQPQMQEIEHQFDAELSSLNSLLVINKCDLWSATESELPHDVLAVSARTGTGIRELMAEIVRRLVPQVPSNADAVPVTLRQIEGLNTARAALVSGDAEAFRRSIAALI